MKNDKRLPAFKSNSGRAVALFRSGKNNAVRKRQKKTGSASNERHIWAYADADKLPSGERTRSSSLERHASDGVVLAYVRFSIASTTILGDHGETAANHPLGGRARISSGMSESVSANRHPRGNRLLLVGVTRKRTRYMYKGPANFYPKPSYDDAPRPRAGVLLRGPDADSRPLPFVTRRVPPIKGERFNRRPRINDRCKSFRWFTLLRSCTLLHLLTQSLSCVAWMKLPYKGM